MSLDSIWKLEDILDEFTMLMNIDMKRNRQELGLIDFKE